MRGAEGQGRGSRAEDAGLRAEERVGASASCCVLRAAKDQVPSRGPDRAQYTVERCIAMLYNEPVIKNFVHKGIERFFLSGSKAGIQPQHAKRLRLQLERLHRAATPQDMNLPNWRLHALKGNLSGHWAVWVDGNWRLTFSFDGEDAILVDYQDYH